MDVPLDINQNHIRAKQAMIDAVLTDKEQFRVLATTALLQFDPRERKMLEKIETQQTSAYDTLTGWQEELLPLRNQLQAKRSDGSFHTSIAKDLLLTESQTDAKLNQLIDERLDELETEFLGRKYADDSTAYENAQVLLGHPEQELSELLSHLIAATLAKIVAEEHDMTIVDPHAGFWKQFTARRRVASERKKAAQLRSQRLAYIEQRQQELLHQNGGLLKAVAEKGWDLVAIIAMRNQYEKRVNTLSSKDAKSVVKRLAVYERVTQQFRDEYVERVNSSSSNAGLEFARVLTKEIDSLLLQIFDLSTIQKNQLLVHSKEYRELVAERQAIVATGSDTE